MDQKLIDLAKAWEANSYFAADDRALLTQLLANLPASATELTECFYRDLEFGTGGLRAPMGMGPNRMNRYNVRRATQALAIEVQKAFGGGSAVISYDSRNNSRAFALEAAGVFAANGIKTYVFSELTPTPMLSFAVRKLGAKTGIMITASHNPPIYNGFKAFWADGAQVVPPTDGQIISTYNNLNDWNSIKFMTFDEAHKKGLAEWVPLEVNDAFYRVIEEKVIQDRELCRRYGGELKIIYTALHGTGQVPCTTIAQRLGFTHFHSVPAQAQPDGNFSTVKSPNPEDARAMKLAVDIMLETGSDVAFGTDPDCDRLGVVVNHRGEAAVINGNQIAVLMLYYVFSRMAERKAIPPNALVIKSIVTSPLQNTIVESFGGNVRDTLTGFKWMAGLIRELEEKGAPDKFVFASEESFGYMPHADCRDKDGVSSVALMSEVALYFKRQGKTLVDALDDIYARYGFYFESLLSLDYEGLAGAHKIGRIMDHFRKYPEAHFAGEKIVATEDYQSGGARNLITKTETRLPLPKSNVLSFTFASGNKLFLRPSGTEPKIKFYVMVRETDGDLSAKKANAMKRVKIIEDQLRDICERA